MLNFCFHTEHSFVLMTTYAFGFSWIVIIHRVGMVRAKESLLKPDQYKGSSCSSSPYLYEDSEQLGGDCRPNTPELTELRRYGAWSVEIQSLKLPQYRTLYLFLCRMPMDVIRHYKEIIIIIMNILFILL